MEPPAGTRVGDVTPSELQLAARNHAMPREALRYPVTPVGLHYLLIHFDIPDVDAAAWRLHVGGEVDTELRLSLDELKRMPAVTCPVTLECAGNGRALLEPRPLSQPWLTEAVSTGEWTGVRLGEVLERAGLGKRVVEVLFTGLDHGVEGGVAQHYQRSLSVADALGSEALLAWAIGDVPLPPQHGFPLRLVVPGWYGMTNVKWLRRITVIDRPFDGYQNARGYRMRQDPDEEGVPVDRMAVRALMVPPGIPDFATRRRFADGSDQTIEGRAWSGHGGIATVEVSTDGGTTWQPAQVDPPDGPHAWQRWTFAWRPDGPGDYELRCRATDSAGNSQPVDVPWNLGGYSNNAVQRVPVTVTA